MPDQVKECTPANALPHAKHWRHNSHVVERMLMSLIVFLFVGLLINAGVQYFRQHLLVTTGTTKEVESFYPGNDCLWKPLTHHGDINISERSKESNTGDTHAIYHYEYKTDIPLEAFLDVLDHPQQSMEWFAWLKDHTYPGVKNNELPDLDILATSIDFEMVLHPMLHLHDRKFRSHLTSEIITAKWEDGNGESTVATFIYTNIPQDATKETMHPECVRGSFDMILQFTSDDNGATTGITMELDMDLNLSKKNHIVPKFMVNNMIMRWGELSLHKLVRRCRDNMGLGTVVDFKGTFLNMLPIKQ